MAGIGQATPMEVSLRTKTATVTIQRWYRKIQMRRKMAEAALKRLVIGRAMPEVERGLSL